MKVYLVNLDKDTAKLAFVDAQLQRLGIAYERVPAVYGKNLSSGEYDAAYSGFRWWCAVGRPIVPAEIGCALSHYGIYRKMKPGEMVCILEDDVILSDDFCVRLAEVERFVDVAKPQVVLLSDHRHELSGSGIRRSNEGVCTDGYVITEPAAVSLLKTNLPMQVPCDHWRRWVKQGRIELYHALPPVVDQDQAQFGTSTQANADDVRNYPPIKWCWHKFKRLIGKSIDCLLLEIGK